MKYKKSHLNIRKHFSYCEGDRTPEQVVQRDCGASILGVIFKIYLYVVTGNLLWWILLFAVGLEWMNSRGL